MNIDQIITELGNLKLDNGGSLITATFGESTPPNGTTYRYWNATLHADAKYSGKLYTRTITASMQSGSFVTITGNGINMVTAYRDLYNKTMHVLGYDDDDDEDHEEDFDVDTDQYGRPVDPDHEYELHAGK